MRRVAAASHGRPAAPGNATAQVVLRLLRGSRGATPSRPPAHEGPRARARGAVARPPIARASASHGRAHRRGVGGARHGQGRLRRPESAGGKGAQVAGRDAIEVGRGAPWRSRAHVQPVPHSTREPRVDVAFQLDRAFARLGRPHGPTRPRGTPSARRAIRSPSVRSMPARSSARTVAPNSMASSLTAAVGSRCRVQARGTGAGDRGIARRTAAPWRSRAAAEDDGGAAGRKRPFRATQRTRARGDDQGGAVGKHGGDRRGGDGGGGRNGPPSEGAPGRRRVARQAPVRRRVDGTNQPTVARSGASRSRTNRRTSSAVTAPSRAGMSRRCWWPPDTSKNASWCARPGRSSRSAAYAAASCRKAAVTSAAVQVRRPASSRAAKTARSASARAGGRLRPRGNGRGDGVDVRVARGLPVGRGPRRRAGIHQRAGQRRAAPAPGSRR